MNAQDAASASAKRGRDQIYSAGPEQQPARHSRKRPYLATALSAAAGQGAGLESELLRLADAAAAEVHRRAQLTTVPDAAEAAAAAAAVPEEAYADDTRGNTDADAGAPAAAVPLPAHPAAAGPSAAAAAGGDAGDYLRHLEAGAHYAEAAAQYQLEHTAAAAAAAAAAAFQPSTMTVGQACELPSLHLKVALRTWAKLRFPSLSRDSGDDVMIVELLPDCNCYLAYLRQAVERGLKAITARKYAQELRLFLTQQRHEFDTDPHHYQQVIAGLSRTVADFRALEKERKRQMAQGAIPRSSGAAAAAAGGSSNSGCHSIKQRSGVVKRAIAAQVEAAAPADVASLRQTNRRGEQQAAATASTSAVAAQAYDAAAAAPASVAAAAAAAAAGPSPQLDAATLAAMPRGPAPDQDQQQQQGAGVCSTRQLPSRQRNTMPLQQQQQPLQQHVPDESQQWWALQQAAAARGHAPARGQQDAARNGSRVSSTAAAAAAAGDDAAQPRWEHSQCVMSLAPSSSEQMTAQRKGQQGVQHAEQQEAQLSGQQGNQAMAKPATRLGGMGSCMPAVPVPRGHPAADAAALMQNESPIRQVVGALPASRSPAAAAATPAAATAAQSQAQAAAAAAEKAAAKAAAEAEAAGAAAGADALTRTTVMDAIASSLSAASALYKLLGRDPPAHVAAAEAPAVTAALGLLDDHPVSNTLQAAAAAAAAAAMLGMQALDSMNGGDTSMGWQQGGAGGALEPLAAPAAAAGGGGGLGVTLDSAAAAAAAVRPSAASHAPAAGQSRQQQQVDVASPQRVSVIQQQRQQQLKQPHQQQQQQQQQAPAIERDVLGRCLAPADACRVDATAEAAFASIAPPSAAAAAAGEAPGGAAAISSLHGLFSAIQDLLCEPRPQQQQQQQPGHVPSQQAHTPPGVEQQQQQQQQQQQAPQDLPQLDLAVVPALIEAAAAAGVDMGHMAALLSAVAGGDVERLVAPAAAAAGGCGPLQITGPSATAAAVASMFGQYDGMGLGLQGLHAEDSCKSSQQALPELAITGAAAAAAAGEPGFADLLLAAAAAASRPYEAGHNAGPAQWRNSGSGAGPGRVQGSSLAATWPLSGGYGSPLPPPAAAAAADRFSPGRQRDLARGGAAASAAGQLDQGSSAASVARVLGQSAPHQTPPRQLVQGVGRAQQSPGGGGYQSNEQQLWQCHEELMAMQGALQQQQQQQQQPGRYGGR